MREAPLRHRRAPRLSEAPAPRHAHPPVIVRRIASEISAGLPTPRQQRRLSKVTPAPFRLTPAVHERYLTLALSRRVPNPAEEKTILGEAGYSHLERLRQQRYVHELRTRPEGFGNRLVEGATKGALGAVHFALPVDLPWQARKAVHDYMRHPTVKGALDVTALTAPVAAGFGDIREPGAPKPEDFVTPSKKSLAAKPEDTRIVQRPRTRQEAEQRLRQLDRQIDTLHRRVGKAMGSPLAESDIAAETQRLRNVKGGRFGQRARGAARDRMFGAPVRRQTVSEELRQQAMNRLEEIARKHPDHPAVVEYNAALAERDFLQNALHGHMPGEEPAGAFGHVAEVRRTPQAEVARSLGAARTARSEQAKLYSAERSARVARGQAAMEEAGGGIAGFKAGMAEQRGELPKVTFDRLRQGNLSQDDLEELVRHAQDHPELQFWQKQNVTKALLDAFEHGRTPAPSEIKLLQTTFGQEATASLTHVSRLVRAGRVAVDVSNIPRTVMASVDLSAPFRQGLVAGARHPALFARSFAPMVKAFGSKRAYQAILDNIHADPNFEQATEAGIKFTDIGDDAAQREEQFISKTAGKLPLVRGSSRAYTGFLNKMRMDMFNRQLELARKQGVNVEDRKELRAIARVVNNATGRGDLGPVEHWAPAMNAFFFSPRLIGSRISMLNPLWYASLTPFARKQALISMIRLGSVAAGVLGLGSYVGAKVEKDPRNADFAKLRIGNTRVDVLGGFQQYVRAGSQIGSGTAISSTTGKKLTLGSGFGDVSRWDIAERFAVGKFAPPPSFVHDFFTGTQFDGTPFSFKKAILQRTVPLVAQDAYDLYNNSDSIPLALLGYSISAFGIGMQTYGQRVRPNLSSPRQQQTGSRLRDARSGGGSLLRRSGSSSSSLLRR